MSSVGRMQNSLYDQWWGYEDGSGNFTEGSLHDIGFDRISGLVQETIDLFLVCGWYEGGNPKK